MHLDIKPDNVLIYENKALLIDFGLSCVMNPQINDIQRCDDINSFRGSLPFIAPEIINIIK